MNNNFSITEYSFIAKSKNNKNYIDPEYNLFLKPKLFDDLNYFTKKNLSNELDFLTIGYKKNIGDVIKTKNYVGIIQTRSGISIEILPKIYGSIDIFQTKVVLLKMLRTLKNVPFISSNMANINISNLHILDIFINMFLNELEILIKRGLKSKYLHQKENLNVLKGKINFSQNIKSNLIHKEKFFCEFNEYNINRLENRLIKSTLRLLKSSTSNSKIEQEILKYLFVFDEIEYSDNINADFQKCSNSRLMNHYSTVINWCKIFLKNMSFTNFYGKEISYALLFPMEQLFECYFASILKKSISVENIFVQKNIGSLLSNGSYKMRPDLVIENSDSSYIFDTKWKIIDERITQADLYQMFAYATKEDRNISNTEKIFLVYPKNKNFDKSKKTYFYDYNNKQLEVNLFPFDLLNEQNSISNIRQELSREVIF